MSLKDADEYIVFQTKMCFRIKIVDFFERSDLWGMKIIDPLNEN